jgi:hypothetical protein
MFTSQAHVKMFEQLNTVQALRIGRATGAAADANPDKFLPTAQVCLRTPNHFHMFTRIAVQTCFFSLALPAYSSKAVLRSKLLLAVHHAPSMDADFVLHAADGWADA